MTFAIRPAVAADLPAISSIYAHYVRSSTSTWAYPEEPLPDFSALFAAHGSRLPWLVAESAGPAPTLAGYAYVAPFRARAGWRFVGEHSIYVGPAWQRRGVGRALLRARLAAAAAAPLCALVGVVSCHPESGAGAASLALHEGEGFSRAGGLPRAGVKAGLFLDCVFLSRQLRDVEEVAAEEAARKAP